MKSGERELRKIKEANLFIRAKQRLNEAELKLWAYAIVNSVEKGGRAYAEVNLKELVGEYLKEDRSATKYYKRVLEGLMRKSLFWVGKLELLKFLKDSGVEEPPDVLIDDGNLDAEIAISPIEFVEVRNNHTARIVFSELISPVILYLSKNFTLYSVEFFKLRGRYSLILYRFLVSELMGRTRKTVEVEVEFLKKLLGLEGRNVRIHAEVVKPALKEINQKTMLKVNVKVIREGRGGRITRIVFDVIKEQSSLEERILDLLKELTIYLDLSEEALKKKLASLKRISPSVALSVLILYPEDLKNFALNRLFEIDANEAIRNPNAYILQKVRKFKDYKKIAWLNEDEFAVATLAKILHQVNREDETEAEQKHKTSKEMWLELF